MKRFLVFCGALFIIFAISGCSKSNDPTDELKPIEVTIQIQPEVFKANEEVTIQALVSHGDEKVNDANEVAFEIQRQGEKEREIINAESKGEGVYEIKTTFPVNGTYDVIAHVTARDMHVMPKKELIVGEPAAEEDEGAKTPSEHENADSHEETGHHHGHAVEIELAPNTWTAGNESILTASVVYDNAPLPQATVKFEVWHENSQKHEYLDATEIKNGKYEASTTFAEQGKYTVKIHVEKDEIHDHKEVEIIVEN